MRSLVRYIFILLICFYSCKNDNDLSNLYSKNYTNKIERLKLINENVVCSSKVFDTEFQLFNVNGFSKQRDILLPGTSSLDYKFVVKIDTSEINKWLISFIKTDSIKSDLNWTTKIIKDRKENWITFSKPIFYKRKNENVILVLYRQEGIIYKRILQN